MSGVGREVGEIDKLLMSIREAQDDLFEQQNDKKNAVKERDEENERIGNDRMHFAMNCSRPKTNSDDDSVSPRPHEMAKNISPEAHVGEMALFGPRL